MPSSHPVCQLLADTLTEFGRPSLLAWSYRFFNKRTYLFLSLSASVFWLTLVPKVIDPTNRMFLNVLDRNNSPATASLGPGRRVSNVVHFRFPQRKIPYPSVSTLSSRRPHVIIRPLGESIRLLVPASKSWFQRQSTGKQIRIRSMAILILMALAIAATRRGV